MRIFSLFDAPMRAFGPGLRPSTDLRIGFQSRLLPACAGWGCSCDYVFLRAGARQRQYMASRAEWWACLRGCIRLAASGHEPLLLGGADLFAPAQGLPMQVHALLDSLLVRVVSDDRALHTGAGPFDDILLQGGGCSGPLGRLASLNSEAAQSGEFAPGGPGPLRARAEFVQVAMGESEWAERLQVQGLRWALCHVGAVGLHWRKRQPDSCTQVAVLQPGMMFVTDPREDYRIEALLPATGLLCCMRPGARERTCGGESGLRRARGADGTGGMGTQGLPVEHLPG